MDIQNYFKICVLLKLTEIFKCKKSWGHRTNFSAILKRHCHINRWNTLSINIIWCPESFNKFLFKIPTLHSTFVLFLLSEAFNGSKYWDGNHPSPTSTLVTQDHPDGLLSITDTITPAVSVSSSVFEAQKGYKTIKSSQFCPEKRVNLRLHL